MTTQAERDNLRRWWRIPGALPETVAPEDVLPDVYVSAIRFYDEARTGFPAVLADVELLREALAPFADAASLIELAAEKKRALSVVAFPIADIALARDAMEATE